MSSENQHIASVQARGKGKFFILELVLILTSHFHREISTLVLASLVKTSLKTKLTTVQLSLFL